MNSHVLKWALEAMGIPLIMGDSTQLNEATEDYHPLQG